MKLDWLSPSRKRFAQLSARLPHALIIYGGEGFGKNVLAMEMVKSLLCDAATIQDFAYKACGQCQNCILFAAGNHPDFHYVSSEIFHAQSTSQHLEYAERYLDDAGLRSRRKPRRVISVDQIRLLIEKFALSHHSAEHKVALIQPAEAMNINAANALLKLLEEPNPQSVLILVSHDISRLPMTIRSRCVLIKVDTPDHDQAIHWLLSMGLEEQSAQKALAIASGAPFNALAFSQADDIDHFQTLLETLAQVLGKGLSPIDAREILLKLQTPIILLSWLQLTMHWLLTVSCDDNINVSQIDKIAFMQVLSPIQNLIDVRNRVVLFSLYDDLVNMKKQDINIINAGLLLDKWLITFSQRLAQKNARI